MNKSAEENFNNYLEGPLNESEKKNLIQNKESLLESDAFDSLLSFGTGGMRQVVEHGSNRMNSSNVARLTLAIAQVLREKNAKSIVIAYDSRLTSKEFASLSYHVLNHENYKVYVFERPTPTPLLSFAVRHLKASAGIVITASHNPKQYNGYKVYLSDGGQIISPYDKKIQSTFNQLRYQSIDFQLIEQSKKEIEKNDIIGNDILDAYHEKLKREAFTRTNISTKILYSPLHGTGGWVFQEVTRRLNYKNFQVVTEQFEPDGNFPDAKSLNPEEQLAFSRLIEQGKKLGSDLLLATDPDADRIGCAIKNGADYILLNGNQIGALLLQSLAESKAKQLQNPFLCKTIVTTELQRKIATSYSVRTIETLTGFKYIANEVAKDSENYLFGGEESYGYLPISWVRDKDSISSAIALISLASQGSLLEKLDNIYLKYGFYHERLLNISLHDKGASFMKDLVEKLYGKKPEITTALVGEKLASRTIIDVLNFSSQDIPATEEGKRLHASIDKSNVLQLWLTPEARITIRPSGTEPKVKIYTSLCSTQLPTKENLESIKKEITEETCLIEKEFVKLLELN